MSRGHMPATFGCECYAVSRSDMGLISLPPYRRPIFEFPTSCDTSPTCNPRFFGLSHPRAQARPGGLFLGLLPGSERWHLSIGSLCDSRSYVGVPCLLQKARASYTMSAWCLKGRGAFVINPAKCFRWHDWDVNRRCTLCPAVRILKDVAREAHSSGHICLFLIAATPYATSAKVPYREATLAAARDPKLIGYVANYSACKGEAHARWSFQYNMKPGRGLSKFHTHL
ncbi:hypothetical protein LIA77_10298 [Sarocladium implicatum]|nr:hypothetical protein LIA77_10298 [Sarocladium implicatum]